MIGLTSVTFRALSPREIIALCAQTGVQGIEWGGDVHVPPDDIATAAAVGQQTRAATLAVLSYGSYYKLNAGGQFAPVLRAVQALGAPRVRIWAGERGSGQADGAYRDAAAAELRAICAQAASAGVAVALEYHRNTLTDTAESTLALLQAAGSGNLRTYWQPNPDLTLEQQLRELRLLGEWVDAVHVFQWLPGNLRCQLAEGERAWQAYLELLGSQRDYILEFVREDAPEQFRCDAVTLARWLKR